MRCLQIRYAQCGIYISLLLNTFCGSFKFTRCDLNDIRKDLLRQRNASLPMNRHDYVDSLIIPDLSSFKHLFLTNPEGGRLIQCSLVCNCSQRLRRDDAIRVQHHRKRYWASCGHRLYLPVLQNPESDSVCCKKVEACTDSVHDSLLTVIEGQYWPFEIRMKISPMRMYSILYIPSFGVAGIKPPISRLANSSPPWLLWKSSVNVLYSLRQSRSLPKSWC